MIIAVHADGVLATIFVDYFGLLWIKLMILVEVSTLFAWHLFCNWVYVQGYSTTSVFCPVKRYWQAMVFFLVTF
jgi:hypothetical protein